ncbi:hypothetical protein [Paraclostridium dentum]|uniref:hypothetical protein n=1 Tax=Paraclostridium dentum TaxID=2662455 RepID=UPI003F2B4154
MDAPGTTLKAVVTYRGNLFEDGDDRYNTMFDYYWYRIDSTGNEIENVYLDNGIIKFINTKDPNYTADNGFPKKMARSIDIKPQHIENKATFTIDLLNKKETLYKQYRANLLRSLPDEEEIRDAKIMAVKAGLSRYDYREIMNTAMEVRAFTIAQEENIRSVFDNKRGE